MTDFISIHIWQNHTQQYVEAGSLIYAPDFNDGAVAFQYDDTYVANCGAALDPHTLPTTLKQGLYVHPAGKGILPPYFQQYLPGTYAEFILSKTDGIWSSLNQFQKLARLSEAFGDQHALQLNAHLDQYNKPVSSMDDLQNIVTTMRNLQITKDPKPLTKSLFIAICSMSGNKPKLDYADRNSGSRYTARVNSSTVFSESRMRAVMYELESKSGIDSASTILQTFPDGQEVALQGNYKHSFLEHHKQHYLLKFNSVPFSALIDNTINRSDFTYRDAANIIRKYSVEPASDIDQLMLRALFSARVNHTSNDIGSMVLIDLGINKWRLAPAINTLPDPAHERAFATPFGNYQKTRQHFEPNQEFAAEFAHSLNLPAEAGILAHERIDKALEQLNSITEAYDLSQSDKAILKGCISGIDIISPKTTSSPSPTSPGM